MRAIGIIGGLSPESSAAYYLKMTHMAQKHFGNHTAMPIIMWSVNTEVAIQAAQKGDWQQVTSLLVAAGLKLATAGAQCVLIPCNSFHKVAEAVQAQLPIPLINIIDCVAEQINAKHYKYVGLLGTTYTTEHGFYRQQLQAQCKANVMLPAREQRKILNEIIFDELCYGIISDSAKSTLKLIAKMLYIEFACEAIILACTELPAVLKRSELGIPFIDTLHLHAAKAVKFSLNNHITLHANTAYLEVAS